MPKQKPPVAIPVITEIETKIPEKNALPLDSEYTELYKNKIDGLIYAVCVTPKEHEKPEKRTHFAKNSLKFWNGTEDDFDATFTLAK